MTTETTYSETLEGELLDWKERAEELRIQLLIHRLVSYRDAHGEVQERRDFVHSLSFDELVQITDVMTTQTHRLQQVLLLAVETGEKVSSKLIEATHTRYRDRSF